MHHLCIIYLSNNNILKGEYIMKVDFMAHFEPQEEEEYNVFDLEIAKSKMDADNANDLVKKAESFTVSNAHEAKQGVALAMQSRKLYNSIEKKRKEIVRPHIDFQKAVKEYADGFSGALKKMEKGILSKVEAFQTEQEEEAARLHAIKVEKEEAYIKSLPEEVTIEFKPTLYIPSSQKIASEDGTSITEQVWKFEIEDASMIPREYLIIDERAIKDSIKAGIRSIPGVKVYSEKVRKYRVSK
jgi:hypothetical protein